MRYDLERSRRRTGSPDCPVFTMSQDDKIRSYLLVQREPDRVIYLAYGNARMTVHLNDARRYGRKASAQSAIKKLSKNPDVHPELLQVEPIDE